jgi:hypothetical protein
MILSEILWNSFVAAIIETKTKKVTQNKISNSPMFRFLFLSGLKQI